MNLITVRLPHHQYSILVGRDLCASAELRKAVRTLIEHQNVLVVSDTNVAPVYAPAALELVRQCGAARCGTVIIGAGEGSKHLRTVEEIYSAAIANGLDRRSVMVALGGGVVGDITGFAAATYIRGIRFIQLPTTLLAMIDSSVGGKTGVDLPAGKNLVGAFHQPSLVVASVDWLTTLPAREIACGLAEMVKYGVIMDSRLFNTMGLRAADLVGLDLSLYEQLVTRCCELKAEVVVEDERETGRRAILNYGHTFGHALEVLGGFSALNHGEAISVGMGIAADLAVSLGVADPSVVVRQDSLLRQLRLPVRWKLTGVSAQDVLLSMYKDKKTLQGQLRLVLPVRIGEAVVRPCTEIEMVTQAVEGRRE